MDDIVSIVQIVITIAVVPMAWHYTNLVQEVQKLKDVVSNSQLEIARDYMSKSDFKEDLHRIESQLDQIYRLLQSKQDKLN
jgi:uncharacterized protein YicC (UPF0701 family)